MKIHIRSLVALTLVITSLTTWSAPAVALRQPTAKQGAGVEEQLTAALQNPGQAIQAALARATGAEERGDAIQDQAGVDWLLYTRQLAAEIAELLGDSANRRAFVAAGIIAPSEVSVDPSAFEVALQAVHQSLRDDQGVPTQTVVRGAWLEVANFFQQEDQDRTDVVGEIAWRINSALASLAGAEEVHPAHVDLSHPETLQGVAQLFVPGRFPRNEMAIDGVHPRRLEESGSLQQATKQTVEEDGVLSMTTNQTLFRQIVASGVLDEWIAELQRTGSSPAEAYATLYPEVAQQLAYIFSVIKRQASMLGRVSQETSPVLTQPAPLLAQTREIGRGFGQAGTVAAVPLGGHVKVANVAEIGKRVLLEATGEGYSINATLVFTLRHYVDMLEAYLRGLAKRVADLQAQSATDEQIRADLEQISSVNSIFISRVDTEVDKRIDAMLQMLPLDHSDRPLLELLRGKTAVAQGKLAYRIFAAVFLGAPLDDGSPNSLLAEFRGRVAGLHRIWVDELEPHGANPQRILYASTGVKDPRLHDLTYVLSFLGPTSNTLTPATLDALKQLVAGATPDQVAAWRARDFVTEGIPAVVESGDNKDAWLAAVLDTSSPRLDPQEVIRDVARLVLEPAQTSVEAIGDVLRDRGLAAFATDEAATVELIQQKMATVPSLHHVSVAVSQTLGRIGAEAAAGRLGVKQIRVAGPFGPGVDWQEQQQWFGSYATGPASDEDLARVGQFLQQHPTSMLQIAVDNAMGVAEIHLYRAGNDPGEAFLQSRAESLRQVTQQLAGLEEPTVAEPVGAVIWGTRPDVASVAISAEFREQTYVVAVGLEEAERILTIGRVGPSQVIAVARDPREADALLALQIPTSQVVRAWLHAGLEAAVEWAAQFGRRILTVVHNVASPRIIQITATTAQGIYQELVAQAPSAWRVETQVGLEQLEDLMAVGA